MISISIISPLKSMAVIDKAIEHNDFGCVFHKYVLNFLQTLVDILVKYASEIVVFDRFIDDSH